MFLWESLNGQVTAIPISRVVTLYATHGSLLSIHPDCWLLFYSRKRFSEKQAEKWWAENSTKVYDRHNILNAEISGTVSPSVPLEEKNGSMNN
ncbi:hypothetical protein HHK36_024748 [Tetracentron sinense]|uniref:BRX domain-containing protein n=1 Tax=Tetracentron sinense TaxID=13715 RepID=A0A835D4J3_TETSI|nr:hypothetical protein HHK36_024748 [Tetracentron sinense]